MLTVTEWKKSNIKMWSPNDGLGVLQSPRTRTSPDNSEGTFSWSRIAESGPQFQNLNLKIAKLPFTTQTVQGVRQDLWLFGKPSRFIQMYWGRKTEFLTFISSLFRSCPLLLLFTSPTCSSTSPLWASQWFPRQTSFLVSMPQLPCLLEDSFSANTCRNYPNINGKRWLLLPIRFFFFIILLFLFQMSLFDLINDSVNIFF